MLKIKDSVDLKILEKLGFDRVQQNKKINYIFKPDKYADTNSITVLDDTNIFTMGSKIGEDRNMSFEFNTELLSFEQTIDLLYDMIISGLIEKVDK